MNGLELKTSLRDGKRSYGTLIVSNSPEWPRVMGKIGRDFVFLCTEHQALGRESLSWMCRTYAAMGIAPVVRIPSPDPYQATAALDDGAQGLVAPYVESADEVRALAGAVKYRPLKGRKLERILQGRDELTPRMKTYIGDLNKDHVLVVNIESRPAIENLDEILAVPELDGILIGPHDLSCSYDMPEDYESPGFTAMIDSIIERARAAGKGVGYHKGYGGPGIEQEILWAEKGMNMIVHEGDLISFAHNMTKDLNHIKTALGAGTKAQQSINI
jgi:4-hydroxy-2-oxoheptanedioate aldolase